MSDRPIDELTGTSTTGHEWDGITELDTPMPRWWLWTFYGTIVFALVYVVLYPAFPLISSGSKGILGWSSRGDIRTELSAATAAQATFRARIAKASIDEIVADPELFQFALSSGRSAFAVNCSQCHGAGANGGPGYPNLQDDDWLWGGSLDEIHATIAKGVRNGTDAAHASQMPAFGRDGILDQAALRNVSAYVASLGGNPPEFGDARAGEKLFADNCASCHGDKGAGNKEFGAPRLSDGIWLYGGSQQQILAQVTSPKHGVMPPWGERLGEDVVKELAIYVYSLGGGRGAR